MDRAEIERVSKGLTSLEREMLIGGIIPQSWGSWMFGVSSDLVAKGLGTKRDGSIQFDTPLADAVRHHLKETK